MKFRLAPLLSILSLCITSVSCGDQTGNQSEIQTLRNTSLNVLVRDWFPRSSDGKIMVKNVPLNIVPSFTFTNPFDPSSIDNFRIRAEDENYRPQEIEITVSPDHTQLSIAPRIGGQPTTWEPNTQYTIHVRYLKDPNGDDITTKTIQFETQSISADNTGLFRVDQVLPTETNFLDILNFRPSTPINIEFTLPIYPFHETCDSVAIQQSVQLINVDIGFDYLLHLQPEDFLQQVSVPAMDADVCLRCAYPGHCSTVVVTPRVPFHPNSGLFVVVNPTSQFYARSIDGQYETLARPFVHGRYVAFDYWWLPP